MQTLRILVTLIALVLLGGCAMFKNTPRQDYTLELGRVCDARTPFWKMQRVETEGRYWIKATTDGMTGRDDYFACMKEQFAATPYRQWYELHKGEYEVRR